MRHSPTRTLAYATRPDAASIESNPRDQLATASCRDGGDSVRVDHAAVTRASVLVHGGRGIPSLTLERHARL
jgi:hypothetical protein